MAASTRTERAVLFWRRAAAAPGDGARALLYTELAALVQAGFGLRAAVASLAERAGRAAPLVAVWAVQVERGTPLHEGMAAHPELFPPLDVALVRVGERSGRLVEALNLLAERLEAAVRTRRAVLGAVAYPALVLHVALLLPTVPLVLLQRGFATWLTLVVAGLCVIWGVPLLALTYVAAVRDEPGASHALCRVPLLGGALHAASAARFAWTLGALQQAGTTADESLREAGAAAGLGWLAVPARAAAERLAHGSSWSDVLPDLAALPPDLARLIATGERSGALAESMERGAALFDERATTAARRAAVAAGALAFALAVLVVVGLVVTVFARVYGPLFAM